MHNYKGGQNVNKRILVAVIAVFTLLTMTLPAYAADISMETDEGQLDVSAFSSIEETVTAVDIPAPSAILIEKETGKVLFEKNADERLQPASVTKIMTILLIVEEMESGRLSPEDMVSTSTYASSMGGSQIYLKEGETMSAGDMLKSIVVSSANDAAVAMAEHISGTEAAFVERMNEKAAKLGMTNTTFTNCTGLLESEEHLTTARDISIMSRELIKHDWIKEYTTIWMDTVRNGEFGLSNTNKLIRYYDGATGLKTGFTSSAGYCLSATASRDGVEYIAVVMNCETSQDRFESAKTLLSYAFSTFVMTPVMPDGPIVPLKVDMGQVQYIQPVFEGSDKILIEKNKAQSLSYQVVMDESVQAPVEAGQVLGKVVVSAEGSVIYEANIVAEEAVERLTPIQIYANLLSYIFCGYAPYGNM